MLSAFVAPGLSPFAVAFAAAVLLLACCCSAVAVLLIGYLAVLLPRCFIGAVILVIFGRAAVILLAYLFFLAWLACLAAACLQACCCYPIVRGLLPGFAQSDFFLFNIAQGYTKHIHALSFCAESCPAVRFAVPVIQKAGDPVNLASVTF